MPTGSISPFRPTGSVAIAATSSSISVPLSGGGDTVVITNASNFVAFIRFGADGGVTATSNDMPVLANSRVILSINSLIGYCAAITPQGSGTIYISRGDGATV